MIRKGFTLIEVLGIIIVLSIISSIAVVTVDKNIKNGKVTVCSAQETNIIESAKSYFVDNPANANKKVTILTLKNGGYLDKELKNPVTDKPYSNDTYVLNEQGKYRITYVDEVDCNGAPGKTISEVIASQPMLKTWAYNATTDFHEAQYKDNITKIIFENTAIAPEGTTSWDVSVSQNGSVKAWLVTDTEDSTKYILHIGGESGVVANKNSSGLFYNFTNLKQIDFNNNFDTSQVTKMTSMFSGCTSLTDLDLSGFDTSNVTEMYSMFYNCSSLKSVDLSSFNTSQATSFAQLFNGCTSLTDLDLSNFDTSNLKSLNYTFNNCKSLKSIGFGKDWDTSKVTNMYRTFGGCESLVNLDVTGFDTSNVTSMQEMFCDCKSLKTLDLRGFDTSNVTTMHHMFHHCESLTNILFGEGWSHNKLRSMSTMFADCKSLTTLDLSYINTSGVTSMEQMFQSCTNLTAVDLTGWDTSNVTNIFQMFYSCPKLKTIYASDTFVVNASSTSNMFKGDTNLVGGNGTTYDSANVGKTYARIDREGTPGYFTLKS